MYRLIFGALVALCFTAQSATAGETPRPRKAYAYIGWPQDGSVITERNFRVWFGLRHMGIAPAGVRKPNTGHHHLLIDTDMPALDDEIPNDKNHRHFGAGQSEMMLELPPGRHTLQLIFADHEHIPHNPPLMSQKITVTVK